METVFEKLGFSSIEAGMGVMFLLIVILFAICIALIIGIITLLVRKRDFSNNITGVSQKQKVSVNSKTGTTRISNENVRMLELRQKNLTRNIDDIYRKLGRSYQKVGIVKYNAYSTMSGNVSFVVAMLDGDDSGFILNVINGREGSNIYIKDITNAQSNERLGAEEIQALKMAVSSGSSSES